MAFKDTVNALKELASAITVDLEKSLKGNGAASQRVRVNTVELEKVAKKYRKESMVVRKKRLVSQK